jgi:hypothetical protein
MGDFEVELEKRFEPDQDTAARPFVRENQVNRCSRWMGHWNLLQENGEPRFPVATRDDSVRRIQILLTYQSRTIVSPSL